MPKPDPDDRQYLDRAIAAWNEWKAPHFRSFYPAANDVKRLWAVALSADWHGSGNAKMERLLTLLPKAIEQASRMPAFSARATFWTICKDAKGLERLAGGIVPGRPEEIEDYDAQVLRVRMPEATLILLRGEAKRLETSPSLLVARIVEDWIEGVDPT
jgi:hypothetical protein